jgi:hypothetical protein
VTQRGVDRRETFWADEDRNTYLRLMTNHVHRVTVPAHADSLSVLFRRVYGRYA